MHSEASFQNWRILELRVELAGRFAVKTWSAKSRLSGKAKYSDICRARNSCEVEEAWTRTTRISCVGGHDYVSHWSRGKEVSKAGLVLLQVAEDE